MPVPGKVKKLKNKHIYANTQISTTIKVVSGYNRVMWQDKRQFDPIVFMIVQ
jgi:hypothetical protein